MDAARPSTASKRLFQVPLPSRSTLVFTNSSAGHGNTMWMAPPRASIASRNRISEPHAALANPMPAFMASSCFSSNCLIASSFSGGNRGTRRSGASIIWPEKMTSFGIGKHSSKKSARPWRCRDNTRACFRVEESACRLLLAAPTAARYACFAPSKSPRITSVSAMVAFFQ